MSMMKLKALIACNVFVVMMINCSAEINENDQLPTSTSMPTPITESFFAYTNDSLAEIMMQVYLDDGSTKSIIVDEQFADGSAISFEFADVGTDEITNLSTEIRDTVLSPNGTFQAFVTCEIEHCQDRLFVEDLIHSRVFEITFAMRMSWRPLSSLAWIDDNVLAFSQSSNPHYGFRFAVDISQRKHLLTLLIADECSISDDCGG